MDGSQPVIDGTVQIAALSITAGSIAASTITAAKMNVTDLSAISANIGSITSGSITVVTGGNTVSLTSRQSQLCGRPTGAPTFTVTQAGVMTAIGGIFKTTAGTGERMVLNSSDNTISFYNSSNAVVSQLGGGTQIGSALRAVLDTSTTIGVYVTSANAGDIGFEFVSSGNYASAGVNVQLTGATGSGTGVNIQHNGGTMGTGISITTTNGARPLTIQNTGAKGAVYISSTAGESMFINHSANFKAIELLNSGNSNALYQKIMELIRLLLPFL